MDPGAVRQTIIEAVFAAIDETNAQLGGEARLAKSLDAPLFGAGAPLDSIGLVNLIVTVEEEVLDRLDVSVILANEKALSRPKSPFRSVGSLVDYIDEVVGDGS